MEEPFVVDTALKIGINYTDTAHSKNKHANLDSNTEVDRAYIPRKTTHPVRCSKRNALCFSASILIAVATLFAVLHVYGQFPGIPLTLKAMIDSLLFPLYEYWQTNRSNMYY